LVGWFERRIAGWLNGLIVGKWGWLDDLIEVQLVGWMV